MRDLSHESEDQRKIKEDSCSQIYFLTTRLVLHNEQIVHKEFGPSHPNSTYSRFAKSDRLRRS